MAARRRPARRKVSPPGAASIRRKTGKNKTSSIRWSQRVTRESHALDLKKGVFKLTSAKMELKRQFGRE